MSAGQLRALLFGRNAPDFAESWVEGPTRRLNYLVVELATRPRRTGYLSLCSVDIGRASAPWILGKQNEDASLEIPEGRTEHYFMLASERPSLVRGSVEDEPCAALSALFPEIGSHPVPVRFVDGSRSSDTDADAARFGFAAIRAARRAANQLRPKTERCYTGATGIPFACNAPGSFVQSLDFRDVRALEVGRCDAGGRLCVDATLSPGGTCDVLDEAGTCGEDHMIVETGAGSLADGETLNETGITSITIRAGGNPVP